MTPAATIEEFFQRCFRERTAALRERLQIHQVYWRRFHSDECDLDSRRGVVEKSLDEKLVSISPSEDGANVVTTGTTVYGSRYRVKQSGNTWMIQEVDMECPHCRRSGASAACTQCRGTGWLSWSDRKNNNPAPFARRESGTTHLNRDGELGETVTHDPAIEQFMADLFCERTSIWRKEREIHSAYASRFHNPQCDWDRWVPSAQSSGDERILSMMLTSEDARIITSGLNKLCLRYHLRPRQQAFEIWQVDSECISCYSKGPNPNCFWCGGSIWNRRKSGDNPSLKRPR